MKISDNKVVTFNYTMTDEEGNVVEGSDDKGPALYLHGHRNMIEPLEANMHGKEEGEKFEVTLPPELAYGWQRSNSDLRVSVKHLQFDGDLEAGMVVGLKTQEGVRPVTVIKPGKFNVDIDTNHPLSGKTLTFNVEILGVRDSTEQERFMGQPIKTLT